MKVPKNKKVYIGAHKYKDGDELPSGVKISDKPGKGKKEKVEKPESPKTPQSGLSDKDEDKK